MLLLTWFSQQGEERCYHAMEQKNAKSAILLIEQKYEREHNNLLNLELSCLLQLS